MGVETRTVDSVASGKGGHGGRGARYGEERVGGRGDAQQVLRGQRGVAATESERHSAGFAISRRAGKLVERLFGWGKQAGAWGR